MDSDDRVLAQGWYHRHFSRRKFVAGAAGGVGRRSGRRPDTNRRACRAEGGLHGGELRGMYLTSKNRLAEGRFGLMFKRLPAFAPPDDLLDTLASTMVEPDTSDAFLATRLNACSPGSRSSGSSSTTTSRWTPRRSISSRQTQMQPSTSGRRATTSTLSTAGVRK